MLIRELRSPNPSLSGHMSRDYVNHRTQPGNYITRPPPCRVTCNSFLAFFHSYNISNERNSPQYSYWGIAHELRRDLLSIQMLNQSHDHVAFSHTTHDTWHVAFSHTTHDTRHTTCCVQSHVTRHRKPTHTTSHSFSITFPKNWFLFYSTSLLYSSYKRFQIWPTLLVPSAATHSMHPIANPFYALSGLVQSMHAELATKYSFAGTMYPFQSACSATPPSHILTFCNSDSPRPSSPDLSHDTRKTFYSLKNLPCFQPHKPPSHMNDYYTTFIYNYATFTPKLNNSTISNTDAFFLYTYYTSSRSTQWSHEHAGGSGSGSDDPDGLRLIPHAGGK